MKNKIIITILTIFLASCSSTENVKSNSETKNNSAYLNTNKTEEKKLDAVKLEKKEKKTAVKEEKKKVDFEIQEKINAIAARGFYFTKYKNVNYVDKRVCENLELQSHRGFINQNENSIDSIIMALDNQFDVVEIDVRTIRDGTWILHHDKTFGRSTGMVDYDNRWNTNNYVSFLYANELDNLVHRDMKSGELTNTSIPKAIRAFYYFNLISNSQQMLNIEIKPKSSIESLEELEYLAFKYIPSGRYFFSSMEFENLEELRKINPEIRLNYIAPVEFESFDVEKRKLEKGVSNDPVYLREKRERGGYENNYQKEKARKNYEKRMVKRDYKYFNKRIGGNFSLSFDIRKFKTYYKSDSLATYRKNGIKVSTYSINGQKYHEEVLKNIPKKHLPDSVIIDDSVYGFCTGFGLPKKKPFSSKSELAMGIYNFPIDLDLERMSEFLMYSKNNLYPSVDGTIKSTEKIKKKESKTLMVGKKEKEEEFELDTGKVISVELRNKGNDD